MKYLATLSKARPFGLAFLFASSLIPSLAHGQCLPEEQADATLFRFHLSATCTAEEKRKYPIQSKEVIEAIKSGKAIDIENSVIQGPFIISSITVEAEVSIKRTRLMDRVDRSYATFRRVLALNGNTFAKSADFTAAAIEKDLLLTDATFEEEASFRRSRIEGLAAFNGAVFEQGASFNSAQINGGAFFRPAISGKEVCPVRFEGVADFISARMGGQAEFNRAVFEQGASFNSTHVEGGVFFQGAKFDKDFDLQGFVYKRIDVSWEDLERRLNPRDAQVYAQLETAFRQSGRSAIASEIYYASRYVEGNDIKFKKEPFRWFNDRRARWLVGYGQSPFRLLWLLLFFVGIGMFVFRREGAVEPKE